MPIKIRLQGPIDDNLEESYDSQDKDDYGEDSGALDDSLNNGDEANSSSIEDEEDRESDLQSPALSPDLKYKILKIGDTMLNLQQKQPNGGREIY
jgi:hypothetical protein